LVRSGQGLFAHGLALFISVKGALSALHYTEGAANGALASGMAVPSLDRKKSDYQRVISQ
jgi:hypothetical protein